MAVRRGSFSGHLAPSFAIEHDRVTITRSPFVRLPVVLMALGVALLISACATSAAQSGLPPLSKLGAALLSIGFVWLLRVGRIGPPRVACTRDGVDWGDRRIAASDVTAIRAARDIVSDRRVSNAWWALEVRTSKLAYRWRLCTASAVSERTEPDVDDVIVSMLRLLALGPPAALAAPLVAVPLRAGDLAALADGTRIYRVHHAATPTIATLTADDGGVEAWTLPMDAGAFEPIAATITRDGDALVVVVQARASTDPARVLRLKWHVAPTGTIVRAPLT